VWPGGWPEAVDFEAAVKDHRAMVFSLAYHLLRSTALAEETAQEVFLQLFQNQGSIADGRHLIHWLRRTTTHRCLDILRRPLHRLTQPLGGLERQAELSPTDPWRERTLRRLVSDLAPTARAAVVLRFQEDLEPREIAELLDVPVATVKSRLHRALAVLRERLAREEEPSHVALRS
jgi:RNA polymerase sigma-70 factor, ECF subfamily